MNSFIIAPKNNSNPMVGVFTNPAMVVSGNLIQTRGRNAVAERANDER